jgi:crotonobetainyl-CoA:carnitine CoA-transferase CaiB-like acyl-CoA transferase
MTKPAKGPLDGVIIVDLTIALAGPYMTSLLAGLGATVIKVENPIRREGRDSGPYFGKDGLHLARKNDDDVGYGTILRFRNKQCVSLNLKHPQAAQVFADLVKRADIVVENFSAGTADRLGVGYEVVRAIKSDVIYCSMNGFGHDGAEGNGKAIDTVIQALSGIMTVSGEETDPPIRIGLPLADLVSPLFGVIGILAALNHKRATGEGQRVDVTMLGAITALMAMEPWDLMDQLDVPKRTGRTVPRLSPLGVYPACDGHIVLCTASDVRVAALAKAMDMPDLMKDPRFATRAQRTRNYKEIDTIVEQWTRARTADEVVARLDAAGIPCAKVRSTAEAIRDPRLVKRGDVVPLAHPVHGQVDGAFGGGIPIAFSATTAKLDGDAPPYAAHNDAIYGGLLGYGADELERMRKDGVI